MQTRIGAVIDSKKEVAKKRPFFFRLTKELKKKCIAIVDDDIDMHFYLQGLLESNDFKCRSYFNAEAFLQEIAEACDRQEELVDIVLSDLCLPGISGADLLREVKKIAPDIPVVLMTAFAEIPSAVCAVKDGAYDYLEKPFDTGRLLNILNDALKYRQCKIESKQLWNLADEELNIRGIACKSFFMQSMYELIRIIAPLDNSILLIGERSVGKKTLANIIFSNSQRKENFLVLLDFFEDEPRFIESELFKAFSREENKGTVLLYNIEGMSKDLQRKLAQFIWKKNYKQLGGRCHDIRFIVTANLSLQDAVVSGAFMEDLYYYFSSITLQVAPLRQRKEDIPVLAKHFLFEASQSAFFNITADAIKKLIDYSYPKNLEELKSIVLAAAKNSSSNLVDEKNIQLPDNLKI